MVVSRPSPAVGPDQSEGSPYSGGVGPVTDWWWYAVGIVIGSALLVVTALRQPFSYDELTQIAPYGRNSVVAIVSGTRQPPIDALLGGLFTHLLGQGQLQQRLVPVLAGIGILVVASLLLRHLGLGKAGAWGVLVLATAPLAVRYGAYSRPYALPVLWMLLFAYATRRWFETRQREWLVVVGLTGVALPLTRVPEPSAFLGVTAVLLTWLSLRGRLRWAEARPVVVISGASLALLGVPLFLLLGSQTQGSFFDPSPTGVMGRAGRGFHEIATSVVPLLGSSFPWWPLTLALLVVVVVWPPARRLLVSWWFFLPLLAGPVAFLLAYHLLNPFSFFALPYRSRATYFFVPCYILVVTAVASMVAQHQVARWWRAVLAVLLAAALVAQLPATANVLRYDAAPDFARISSVLTSDVPDDAVVLYDRPTPAGQSRQPFQGRPRYMGATPYVATIAQIANDPVSLPRAGPVYVLINGQCARPGRCRLSRSPWVRDVPGWRLVRTQERFSLYAPRGSESGRAGVLKAMHSFGTALGPELGFIETLTAAALVERQGHHEQAVAMVRRLRAEVSPLVRQRIDYYVRLNHFPLPG